MASATLCAVVVGPPAEAARAARWLLRPAAACWCGAWCWLAPAAAVFEQAVGGKWPSASAAPFVPSSPVGGNVGNVAGQVLTGAVDRVGQETEESRAEGEAGADVFAARL